MKTFNPIEALEPRLFLNADVTVGGINLENGVPMLHSDPGAPVAIYLDFDGNYEKKWLKHKDVRTPAFSLDHDPAFSKDEREQIVETWRRVSEDFAPFRVDVTTERPDAPLAKRRGVHVVIGGRSTDWYSDGAWGGVGQLNSFRSGRETPVFVFSDTLDDYVEVSDLPRRVADAASHEVGHALGLEHHCECEQSAHGGKATTDSYMSGHGRWAPLMGYTRGKSVSTWHYGSIGGKKMQDDMEVITSKSNRIEYRRDDYADVMAEAAPIGRVRDGVIGHNSDVDWFRLTLDGVSGITLETAVGTNLEPVITLYDTRGNPLMNETDSLDTEGMSGPYYLKVQNNGEYGRVGRYTVLIG